VLPNGDRVVPFGDGGSMTYPKGYAGVLLDTEAVWGPPPGGGDGDEAGDAAGVVAGAGEGVGGGGGGGENEGNSEENEVEAAKARLAEAQQQRLAAEAATAEAAAAAALATGDAAAFFGALLRREGGKPTVGTTHATGKNVGEAVSGQGIMAGVRQSTKRPTGMGGGAIPHDQLKGEKGEWSCNKCGRSNERSAGQCKNCSAMRRMNQYVN